MKGTKKIVGLAVLLCTNYTLNAQEMFFNKGVNLTNWFQAPSPKTDRFF